MKKKLVPLALGPVAAAIAVAGCGGGYSKGAKPASASTGHPTATVAVRSSKLGPILTDGHGRTLYLFEADKGTASACYSACASVWPPLIAQHPTAGAKAVAGKLGTTKRKGGETEVTYNGHPLYYYAGDNKAGDTTGQGVNQFGAKWYVLGRGGAKIDND